MVARGGILSRSKKIAKRSRRELINKTLDEDYPGLDYLGLHSVLVARKRWYCIAWFILLIICLIGGLVTVYQVIREYHDNPSVTKVTVRSVDRLPLPTLSICATSPSTINITKLFDFLNGQEVNGELIELSMDDAISFARYMNAGSGFQKVQLHTIANMSHMDELYEELRGNRTVQQFFEYFYNTFGLSCSELFESCQLRLFTLDCCKIFKPFYAIRRGRCFRISETLDQTTFDEMGRLTIRMRDYRDYEDPREGRELIAYIGDERVEIAPFPRYYLYSNTNMRLQVKATRMDLVETDGVCTEEYSNLGKSTCYLDSWFRKYLEEPFNCTYPYMDRVRESGRQSCHPSIVIANYANTVENPHYHKHTCLLPCKRWEYSASMERVYVSKPRTPFRVDVFYNDLQFEEFTGVYTTTFWGLLAQIGGQLSLFLGSSILSLVQLFILGVVVSNRVVKHAEEGRQQRSRRIGNTVANSNNQFTAAENGDISRL